MEPIPPFSLAALAAIAKGRGHEVEVWDQFATREDERSLVSRLTAAAADMVGITSLTPAYPTARRILKQYRDGGGRGMTVLGGVHPTIFHREILAEKAADGIVRREGETPFAELLAAVETKSPLTNVAGLSFRDGDEIVVNPDHEQVADLTSLPFPAWECLTDGLDVYAEAPTLGLFGRTLPILASRGCPMRCTFCGQEIFHKGVRTRPVEHVLEEVRFLQSEFRIRNFVFLDANFPTRRADGIAFCNAMRESGLHRDLHWSAELAVSLADRELIFEMASAGCTNLEFGFEVGDAKVLKETRKGTTLEQAYHVARWAREAGIHVFGLFMIGLPGENTSHLRRTFRVAKRLDCDMAKFNVAIPYPGCELFERHREELMRDFDPETYCAWFRSSDKQRRVTVVPGGMSATTLLLWQRLMMFAYYLRPRMIARHLRRRSLRMSHMRTGFGFLLRDLASAAWAWFRAKLASPWKSPT